MLCPGFCMCGVKLSLVGFPSFILTALMAGLPMPVLVKVHMVAERLSHLMVAGIHGCTHIEIQFQADRPLEVENFLNSALPLDRPPISRDVASV